MTTLEEIIAAAKTLSAADRLRLVDAVWDDASPESWPRPSLAAEAEASGAGLCRWRLARGSDASGKTGAATEAAAAAERPSGVAGTRCEASHERNLGSERPLSGSNCLKSQ